MSSRLRLKLELTPSRESTLHFFEQIRRHQAGMNRLRRRDDGGLVLDDEERGPGGRRFVRLDADTLKFGVCGPSDVDAVRSLGQAVLECAPTALSLSDLDYDHLETVFGFDLEYCGNHDELVAETLFSEHPLIAALAGAGQRVIDFQPFLGVALSEDCDLQAYVEIKSRTSAYEVRCGDYDPASLGVFLTLRRFWAPQRDSQLTDAFSRMLGEASRLAETRIVPHIVHPLATAIASRR